MSETELSPSLPKLLLHLSPQILLILSFSLDSVSEVTSNTSIPSGLQTRNKHRSQIGGQEHVNV